MAARAATSRGWCMPIDRLLSRQVAVAFIVCCSAVVAGDDGKTMKQLQHGTADKSCYGFDEEWAMCTGLPVCAGCVPQHCAFAPWSPWSYMGGCTKLCYRTRIIGTEANECGTSCTGTGKQTKECEPPAGSRPCDMTTQDCVMGPWEAWIPLSCNGTKQKERKRSVLKYPMGDNATKCNSSIAETMPCAAPALPVDCILSAWSMWSACDKTCDSGYRTRSRAIVAEAVHGGTCPPADLIQLEPCEITPCLADSDCTLTPWSNWTKYSLTQWSRYRQIAKATVGSGKRCTGPLFEIKEPPAQIAADCEYNQWQAWSTCSRMCGGGQKERHRTMKPWNGLGKCPPSATEEVAGCFTQMCGNECAYSAWSMWSACSTNCGEGTQTRFRNVTSKGLDCDGVLEEVEPCKSADASCIASTTRNCTWGLWTEWGACTTSCGGGSTYRSRSVKTPPGKDGQACQPLTKAEVKPCGTSNCHPCVDGVWNLWSTWAACSASCGVGVRSRNRTAKAEANYCGTPLTGKEKEYEKCNGPPCAADVDCALSLWSSWSSCLPACFGVASRTRAITQQVSGNGKPCVDSMKEMRPCNPGVGEAVPPACARNSSQDCVLSLWTQWSACTADCSGTRQRHRHINKLPSYGGKPCTDTTLSEVQGCNTTKCHPVECRDCKWGAWGEWTSCARCKGQRSRFRAIKALPNFCGKRCESRTTEETQNCTGICEGVKYCVWQDWSVASPCPTDPSTSCGAQTYRRSRTMQLVNTLPDGALAMAKGGAYTKCQGYDTDTRACPYVKCAGNCAPQDCGFGPWSEWSQPTCTGSCERSRSIVRAPKCGGEQCKGSLVESKGCMLPTCEMPMDCKLSGWSAWTPCVSSDPTEQKTKGRSVIQMPKFGGRVCEGPLRVTAGCWEQLPVDCKWSQWSNWASCTASCGSGTTTRKRSFEVPVEYQGQPCKGETKEIQTCFWQDCPLPAGSAPCKWSMWSPWKCGIKYAGMMSRSRDTVGPSALMSVGCSGSSEEVEPCNEAYEEFPWTSWSSCTTTCGGGQMTRTRQGVGAPKHGVPETFPKSKLPKNVPLKEVSACATVSCAPDLHAPCTVSNWETWSLCSSTCGVGQQTRKRAILGNRHKYGKGCEFQLAETTPCSAAVACPAKVDCAWGNWAPWQACNKPCDGGEKLRVRSVSQPPLNGGKQCEPIDREEVEPCNQQKCAGKACVDGVWGTWSSWTPCSLTCNPGTGHTGLTSRSRGIEVYANDCGKPLEGPTKQYKSCSEAECPSQACTFTAWGEWSDCPATCDGFARRHRQVQKMGFGPKGKACKGTLEQTRGCAPCKAVMNVDCKFSEWFNGPCTATCGGGRFTRTRHIEVPAKNAGKPCSDALKETDSCNPQACPMLKPVDCTWGEWVEWGPCDTCGPTGQRKRSRVILASPLHGGKACEKKDSEEMKKCDTPCPKTYCTWGQWQAFGACTATCGKAHKSRRRYLFSTTVKSPAVQSQKQLSQKFAELQAQIAATDSTHFRDLTIAFTAGCLAFVVLFLGCRAVSVVRSRRNSRAHYASLSAMNLAEDTSLYPQSGESFAPAVRGCGGFSARESTREFEIEMPSRHSTEPLIQASVGSPHEAPGFMLAEATDRSMRYGSDREDTQSLLQ